MEGKDMKLLSCFVSGDSSFVVRLKDKLNQLLFLLLAMIMCCIDNRVCIACLLKYEQRLLWLDASLLLD